jgi:hypothetical protein
MSLSAGNGEQHLLRLTLSTYVGQEHIKRHLRWLINVVKEHWGGDLLLPNLLLWTTGDGKSDASTRDRP